MVEVVATRTTPCTCRWPADPPRSVAMAPAKQTESIQAATAAKVGSGTSALVVLTVRENWWGLMSSLGRFGAAAAGCTAVAAGTAAAAGCRGAARLRAAGVGAGLGVQPGRKTAGKQVGNRSVTWLCCSNE